MKCTRATHFSVINDRTRIRRPMQMRGSRGKQIVLASQYRLVQDAGLASMTSKRNGKLNTIIQEIAVDAPIADISTTKSHTLDFNNTKILQFQENNKLEIVKNLSKIQTIYALFCFLQIYVAIIVNQTVRMIINR